VSVTDELLKNNEAYAERYEGAGGSPQPVKKVAILACMDARILPSRALGLKEGEAHIIRNAGGVVTDDAIRSLAISQHMLGTEEILVIQHTDCGLLKASDEEIARTLEEHAGEPPPFDAHAFDDLEQNLRESVAKLKASPFLLHKTGVRGFVFDVETGRLTEVS
jgi:carbonic anhydrase